MYAGDIQLWCRNQKTEYSHSLYAAHLPLCSQLSDSGIYRSLECMEALPEKQRLCIRYFFMDELSYKEIGQTSGFTLKMVKSFIQNGKRNLQLCLERKGIKANE